MEVVSAWVVSIARRSCLAHDPAQPSQDWDSASFPQLFVAKEMNEGGYDEFSLNDVIDGAPQCGSVTDLDGSIELPFR